MGTKEREKQRIQAAEIRVFRKIAGMRRMDHVRNDDIRSQLRQEGVVEQEKMKFERMGRRANWIYDRDSDERNCTREKTKREAKKVMER